MLIAGLPPAAAQNRRAAAPHRPARAVQAGRITPPTPLSDAGFDAMRKQLGEAAKRKDRAALAKLVVAQGLLLGAREPRHRRQAQVRRRQSWRPRSASNNKDSAGWDILAGYAEDPTAAPSAEHKGAFCAPADPAFNRKEFDELIKATQSERANGAIRCRPASRCIARAGQCAGDRQARPHFRARDAGEPRPPPPPMCASSRRRQGRLCSVDAIAPVGNDQLCYVKDGGAWKIGGYIGGGEPQ